MPAIRYTLDGTDPTETHGHVYSGSFELPFGVWRVRAITYGDGLEKSEISEAVFTINDTSEPEPEPEPEVPGEECVSVNVLNPGEPVSSALCQNGSFPSLECSSPGVPTEPPVALVPSDPVQVCIFRNDEQTCTNYCTGDTAGEPISYTVEANDPRFDSSVSKEAANAAALAYACQQAALLREATPCEPFDTDAPVAPEFRYKIGTAECVPDLIGNTKIPTVYSGGGFGEACIDQYGQYVIGAGEASPVELIPNADGEYAGVRYILTNSFVSPHYALACGVARGIIVAATPADNSPLWDGDTGYGGPASVILSQRPIRNPYAFISLVVYDLTGTRVAIPGSVALIDVSKVKFLGCRSGADDYIETEGVWIPTDITQIGHFTPNTGSSEVEFLAIQVRLTLGTVEEPLTVGFGYRVIVRVTSRNTGSSDIFQLDSSEVTEFDFIAISNPHVTDWITLPFIDNKDIKYHSASVIRVPTPTSIVVEPNGRNWTFHYDMPVFIGSDGYRGLFTNVTGYEGVDLTYVSGAGTNSLVFSGSRLVTSDQIAKATYSNLGDSIKDSDNVGAFEFTDYSVTNNSAVSPLDNFDTLSVEALGSVQNLVNAQPWGGNGQFIVFEYLYCIDTLTQNSNGSNVISVIGGSFFEDVGGFILMDHTYCLDELTSNSNGAITSVTSGSGWLGNGEFI